MRFLLLILFHQALIMLTVPSILFSGLQLKQKDDSCQKTVSERLLLFERPKEQFRCRVSSFFRNKNLFAYFMVFASSSRTNK